MSYFDWSGVFFPLLTQIWIRTIARAGSKSPLPLHYGFNLDSCGWWHQSTVSGHLPWQPWHAEWHLFLK